MHYIVNLEKAPRELVTELINYECGTVYTPEMLSFTNLNHLPNGKSELTVIKGNTTVLKLTYNRIKLNKIFSLVDIKIPYANTINETELLQAIAVKYKIQLPPTDFRIVVKDGYKYLTASSASIAYLGEYPILEIDLDLPEVPTTEIREGVQSNITLNSVEKRPLSFNFKANASYTLGEKK